MTKISNKFDKILPNHHYLAKPACINRDNKIDNLIGSILENNKEKYLKNRFSKMKTRNRLKNGYLKTIPKEVPVLML
jgi:hypothetical protein